MDLNYFLVFDLETGGKDVNTCQLLELAAVVVDPIAVKVLPETEFQTLVRPEDEATLDPSAMAVNKLDLNELREAPPAKVALSRFNDHIGRFFKGRTKSSFKAPYPAGKNIRGFDLPILIRYFERFGMLAEDGNPKCFNRHWAWELEDDLFRWFGQTNILPNLGMDTVRDYLGLKKDGAHRAMTDVRQTAAILCKFIHLYRSLAPTVEFQGSMSD